MKQVTQKLGGLLALPVLLAALLLAPVRAHAQDYACTADPPVQVELNGARDETFHVTIQPAEGAAADQPLPDEAADGLWLAGDSSAAFHNFRFTQPGDYVYTVAQQPGDTEHMTYDSAVYTVVIQVTNLDTEAGTVLQHQVFAWRNDAPDNKVTSLCFLNTYAPPPEPTPAATTEPAPTAEPAPPAFHIPQTGDAMPFYALAAIAAAAAVGIVVLLVLRKRRKQDEP